MEEPEARITVGFGVTTLRDRAETGEAALEQLYDEYAHALFRYALSLLGSAEDAEDAVQDVFIRIARERRRLDGVRNPKAYLFAAARNAAYSILRSKRRRNEIADETHSSFHAQPAAEGPSAKALALRERFALLPVEQREVLALKIFEQMTFREIAKAVGASISTVASRYRAGIATGLTGSGAPWRRIEMDDRRIEKMLRESWSPEPPNGMKQRIIQRNREELARQRSRRPAFRISRWKPLLASMAILFVILANVSDRAAQSRLAKMMDGRPANSAITPCAAEGGLFARHRELRRMLALSPRDGGLPDDLEGDDRL